MIFPELGERIAIIGPSGSGKSTLAALLSKKLNYPCCHIDTIAHLPNTKWERRDNATFLKMHRDFLENNNNWVMEGNYKRCMPERFLKADTIIFLKFSRFICLWYYIKRCFFPTYKRYGKLQGTGREFSFALLKYTLFEYPKKINTYKSIINQYKDKRTYVEIKNRKELNQLYYKIGLKL